MTFIRPEFTDGRAIFMLCVSAFLSLLLYVCMCVCLSIVLVVVVVVVVVVKRGLSGSENRLFTWASEKERNGESLR